MSDDESGLAAWRGLYLGRAPTVVPASWEATIAATGAILTRAPARSEAPSDAPTLAAAVERLERSQRAVRRFERPDPRWLEPLEGAPDDVVEQRELTRWLASILFDARVADEPAARAEHALSVVLRPVRVAYRALALARVGELDEARNVARRASRMGRSEALPYAEHVAHLTLARIRRMSGNPHLAAHILTALGRFAPPSLLSWVRYELTLCIGPPGDLLPDAPATPIDPGALIVASPDAFARACAALRDAARNRPFAEGELGALTAMLDPSVAPTSDARAWVAGTSASPPFGLHGVSVATDNAPYGVVLAHPGRPARRVLRIAADRLGIEPRGLGKDRIDAAAATLLLAPDTGLTSTELFEAVYGFTYKPKLHSGSLRVVLHRLRGGDLPIAIERVDERIAARALEPLAVYDPRCVHSVHDSVLRYIATHPETVAKEIAANLGMPARSTQRALSSLVDEGWCARVGSGPSTAYRVEDTTFSEPTAWS